MADWSTSQQQPLRFELLGEGAFGAVYKGKGLEGRTFAYKVLKEAFSHAKAVRREDLSKLCHPHVGDCL